MVELCWMSSSASASSLPGLVLQQERGFFRASNDWLPPLRNHSVREDITLSTSVNLKPLHSEDFQSNVAGLSDSSKFITLDSTITRPVLIDIHESRPNSALFGCDRVAEKSTRHEEIVQFLTSRYNEVEENMLNPILLSNFGLQTLASDLQQIPSIPFDYMSLQGDPDFDSWPSFIYPTGLFHAKTPLLDIVGHLAHNSELILDKDGQILFTGTKSEMTDLLSFISEFSHTKNHTSYRKKQSVVPYFRRRASRTARGSSIAKASTVKSPEKVNLKPSLSKSNNKGVKGKTTQKKDYFRACEILLSLMMSRKREDKTTILLLKKSGPELPEILTQCSASIAGTGAAILFSVVCKLACGKVPLCGSNVFTSSLALGLVWLSWTVTKLRNSIIQVSKNPSNVTTDGEDLLERVDKNVNDIFVSAATLMAVALLRFKDERATKRKRQKDPIVDKTSAALPWLQNLFNMKHTLCHCKCEFPFLPIRPTEAAAPSADSRNPIMSASVTINTCDKLRFPR